MSAALRRKGARGGFRLSKAIPHTTLLRLSKTLTVTLTLTWRGCAPVELALPGTVKLNLSCRNTAHLPLPQNAAAAFTITLMASLADVIAAAQREEDRLREEREAFAAAHVSPKSLHRWQNCQLWVNFLKLDV